MGQGHAGLSRTSADLRARIAETVAQQKADALPRLKENACLTAIAERLEGEVPEAMCEQNEASLIPRTSSVSSRHRA